MFLTGDVFVVFFAFMKCFLCLATSKILSIAYWFCAPFLFFFYESFRICSLVSLFLYMMQSLPLLLSFLRSLQPFCLDLLSGVGKVMIQRHVPPLPGSEFLFFVSLTRALFFAVRQRKLTGISSKRASTPVLPHAPLFPRFRDFRLSPLLFF